MASNYLFSLVIKVRLLTSKRTIHGVYTILDHISMSNIYHRNETAFNSLNIGELRLFIFVYFLAKSSPNLSHSGKDGELNNIKLKYETHTKCY